MQRDNPGSRERVIYAGNRTITPTDVRKGHIIINTALSGAVLTMFSPARAYRDWEFWVTNDGNSGNDVTLSGNGMFIGGLGTAIVDPRKTIGYVCKQDYSGTYRWMQWGDAQNLDLVSISGMASGASGTATGISGIAQSGYDMGSGGSGLADGISGIAQSGYDMASAVSGDWASSLSDVSGIAQSGMDLSGIAQSGMDAYPIATGASGIATGGSGIAAGGSGIAAGGSGIAAGGSGIAAGASGIAAGGSGIAAGASGQLADISGVAQSGMSLSGYCDSISGVAQSGMDLSGYCDSISGVAQSGMDLSGYCDSISGVAQSGMDLSGIAQSGMDAYPVATGGSGIAAGASGLADGGSGIAAGGSGIAAGASGIATGGSGIAAGASGIAVGASGQLHTTMSGWTPTFSWTTGDPSGLTYVARYRQDTEICEGYLYLYGLDGSGATAVTVSPPVTPQDTNARVAFACMQEISGVYIAGVTMDLDCVSASPANRIFTIRNMNAWSGGMSGQLSFHFSYEV